MQQQLVYCIIQGDNTKHIIYMRSFKRIEADYAFVFVLFVLNNEDVVACMMK